MLFRYKKFKLFNIILMLIIFESTSCKKLIEVDPPITTVTGINVFNNDATAISALTQIYAGISALNTNIGNEGLSSISLLAGLSADEITLFNLNNADYFSYFTNDLTSSSYPNLWGNIYSIIFITNSAIEGISANSSITPSIKQQLLGEAKFMRAFCYFYLVSLYGDVPLALTTDYKVNSLLHRASTAQVYQQIVGDLKEAKNLLSDSYLDATLLKETLERVRPTKWAAAALLARIYLYNGDWKNAEIEASDVINQNVKFNLVALGDVFNMNSLETIWALQPVGGAEDSNTGEGKLFILPPDGPSDYLYEVYLNPRVVNSFEIGDQRKDNWVGSVTVDTITYNYPYKYKIGSINTTTQEYIMVMRFAEQFLIRAEARAHQNNLSGASDDLNVIRSRAGLPNATGSTQETLLKAIQHERQVELFTEWGHRWLDLKRTSTVDAVMSLITPEKGGNWSQTDQLYSIPVWEISANPNLVQNPGYN